MIEEKEKQMNIICSQESLMYGIQIVQKGISSKIGLPIFNGILFETCDNNTLHLFATDLEVGIDCYIPAQVIEEGKAVLPNRIIGDLIKKLPEGNITIEGKDNFSTIIKQKSSKYKVLGFNAEDFSSFPEMKVVSKMKLSQKILKEAIEKIIFAVSRAEGRAFLTGALFKVENSKIEMSATDSHRLALKNIVNNSAKKNSIKDIEAIIPYRTLSELYKLLSEQEDTFAEVNVGERQILFILYPGEKQKGIRVYSRLLEGRFPNCRQIMPKSFKTEIKVDTNEFAGKMERISLFTKEEVGKVKMKVKDSEIVLSVESPEIGEAYEKMQCNKIGEDVEIAFNSKYVLDILNVVDIENIEIKLNGNLNPIIVNPEKDKDYLCILMPIRIE